jgi:hypothetical protein
MEISPLPTISNKHLDLKDSNDRGSWVFFIEVGVLVEIRVS